MSSIKHSMSDATRRGVYHQQHKPPGARLHVTCKNCADFFRNCLSRKYIQLAREAHNDLTMTLGTDCGCHVTNTTATWHNDCPAAAWLRANTSAVQLRDLVSQSPPTTRTWAAARWHACVALDMLCHPGSPRGGNNMHHTTRPWVAGTPCAVQSYMDDHPPAGGGSGGGQGGAAGAAPAPVLPATRVQATAAALPATAAAAVAVTAPALAPTHASGAGGAGGGGGAGGAAGARAAAPGVAAEEEPMFAMEDLEEAACALLVAAAGTEAVEANVLATVEVTIGEPDEDHLLLLPIPADDAAMEELWRSFDDGDDDGMEDLEDVPHTADAAASAAAVDATFFMPVDSLMGDPDDDDLPSW